jgi:hypothetical protein
MRCCRRSRASKMIGINGVLEYTGFGRHESACVAILT